MIESVDFVLYCLGTSIVLVSSAAAVRLISRPAKSKTDVRAGTAPKWEPTPEPSSDGLEDRLRAFQAMRYASPIVRRQLDTDAGPRFKSPAPPVLIKKPGSRGTEDDKVVPLPSKLKKEPKKED